MAINIGLGRDERTVLSMSAGGITGRLALSAYLLEYLHAEKVCMRGDEKGSRPVEPDSIHSRKF